MDNDIMDKVSALLADPEMASRIAAIAGVSPPKESPPAMPASEVRRDTLPSIGDPRIALLSSIKPLLKQEKRSKVDNLVKAMTVVTMLGGLKNGGGS